jgi:hypothetical protein
MLYPLSYEGGEVDSCRSEAACRSRGRGLLVGVPVACPIRG